MAKRKRKLRRDSAGRVIDKNYSRKKIQEKVLNRFNETVLISKDINVEILKKALETGVLIVSDGDSTRERTLSNNDKLAIELVIKKKESEKD